MKKLLQQRRCFAESVVIRYCFRLIFFYILLEKVKVPKAVLKNVGMPLLKKSIIKKAGFDIHECSPIKHVESKCD